ncbi:hypothetical protein PHYPSEUDO_008925 [Phytophthora pseudosyringae]|uniref:Uncharacterized protein n=1 Tax=Phytophthora pseudosyringae TaxID=221518 RepID=A0A8T1VG72_9STRA|nr:hypothetical protein PHYPSEUDO_008925 [Phytophthora pseudosyringae]
MLATYVSALALSFVAFQAGQEIYLPELRPQLKAMVILTSVHLFDESAFFYDDVALSCQLGIALMFSSISVLGSPAIPVILRHDGRSAQAGPAQQKNTAINPMPTERIWSTIETKVIA